MPQFQRVTKEEAATLSTDTPVEPATVEVPTKLLKKVRELTKLFYSVGYETDVGKLIMELKGIVDDIE